jgi:hypothetical protein
MVSKDDLRIQWSTLALDARLKGKIFKEEEKVEQ